MRSKFILPIALLAVTTACAGAGFISSADAAPPRASAVRYTDAPAFAAPQRTVQIQVDRTFTLHERAKILRAVNEWNHVLNGRIRLDVSPHEFDATPVATGGRLHGDGWAIVKTTSSNPLFAGESMKRALAVTTGTRRAVIMVVANRIGSRDLGGIMMHEIGHALGAAHDHGSELMHPFYTGNKQRCIDKGAAVAVAVAQKLSIDDLNWCGGNVAIGATSHKH